MHCTKWLKYKQRKKYSVYRMNRRDCIFTVECLKNKN